MNVLVVNLTMGVFWLFLGFGVLAAESMWGPLGYRPLGISVGWWALILSTYNWVKLAIYWFGRSRRKAMVTDWEEQRTTLARREAREKGAPPAPDPTFQFTDQPPGAEQKPM